MLVGVVCCQAGHQEGEDALQAFLGGVGALQELANQCVCGVDPLVAGCGGCLTAPLQQCLQLAGHLGEGRLRIICCESSGKCKPRRSSDDDDVNVNGATTRQLYDERLFHAVILAGFICFHGVLNLTS